jgi:general stress protein YciG
MTDQTEDTADNRSRARSGFAAMDPAKLLAVSKRGGASVPARKRSFSQDHNLAVNAGRAGGELSRGGGRPRKLLV